MTESAAALEQARDAAGRRLWSDAYRLLRDQARDALTATDLEALADAAWWLSRVEESLAVRREAHAAFVAAGDARRAAFNAWMLSVEYGFIGKPALAAGWRTKAGRHLADEPECVEHAYLAFAEAEAAEAAGDLDAALAHAHRMLGIGTRCGSLDIVALARQLEARLRVADGLTGDGLALLDEVMGDVLADELGDLVTGWVYCAAIALCFEVADVARAAAWNEAAMSWCATLPAGSPFRGLCRVHHVELLGLGGAWAEADAEADRACAELTAYHPRMAGEAFYVAGELRRRLGRTAAAEAAFGRAHECGRDPQPGLALLRIEQGRPDEAAAALRSCLAARDWRPLSRARLLAAHVEAALACGDVRDARDTADALGRVASASAQALPRALATTAHGAVALHEGGVASALDALRRARNQWLDLAMPYETAETRALLARAYLIAGDNETARLELAAARSAFEQLGSAGRARRIDALRRETHAPVAELTPRQLQVLRLVAAGKTNRAIAAELVISEHTVARHVDNIYARLDVSSRAAATSYAHTHGLV